MMKAKVNNSNIHIVRLSKDDTDIESNIYMPKWIGASSLHFLNNNNENYLDQNNGTIQFKYFHIFHFGPLFCHLLQNMSGAVWDASILT